MSGGTKITPPESPFGPPAEPSGEVDIALRAARYWITVHRPYYARALFACRLLVTSSVQTMSIDRQWRLYANPAYVRDLNVAELAGLIIHNLNHGLRDHAARASVLSVEARLGNVWTVAADCEIDDDLAADGLTLPEGMPFPYMWEMSNGGTAERYYRDLHDNGYVEQIAVTVARGELIHGQSGSAASGFDQPFELPDDAAEGVSGVEQELLRRSTAEAVRNHEAKHGIGAVPNGLKRWADARLESKVDWRRTLASALRRALHQRTGMADYSWRRPPRRQQPGSPLQFPGMVQPVPSLAVVMDTSGSLTDADLAQGIAEIESILTRVVPGHAIRLLSVDAEVASAASVIAGRGIELVGGGGTDMRIGIEKAAKSRPAAIVVITDGYTPWPESRPRGASMVIAAILSDPDDAEWRWGPPDVPSWIARIDVPVGR